jgi:mediator of RNA polymerase II transcription subunit 10
MQVVIEIDNARNPMQLTRERLERAATENQFMNGKIAAISASLDFLSGVQRIDCCHQSYHKYLDEAIIQSYPELEPQLKETQS